MRPKDYINKKAQEEALKAFGATQLNNNQETSPYFVGKINADRTKITDPGTGRQYNLIFTGNPKQYEWAQRLSNDTAIVNAQNNKTINVDSQGLRLKIGGNLLVNDTGETKYFIRYFSKPDEFFFLPEEWIFTIPDHPYTVQGSLYVPINFSPSGKHLWAAKSTDFIKPDTFPQEIYNCFNYVVIENFRLNRETGVVTGDFSTGSVITDYQELGRDVQLPQLNPEFGIPASLTFRGPISTPFFASGETTMEFEEYETISDRVIIGGTGTSASTFQLIEVGGRLDFNLAGKFRLQDSKTHYIRINSITARPNIIAGGSSDDATDRIVFHYSGYADEDDPLSIQYYPLRTNSLVTLDPFVLSADVISEIYSTIWGNYEFYNFFNFVAPPGTGLDGFQLYTNGEVFPIIRTMEFPPNSPGGESIATFVANRYTDLVYGYGTFFVSQLIHNNSPAVDISGTEVSEQTWNGVPTSTNAMLPWNMSGSLVVSIGFSATGRIIYPDCTISGLIWTWLQRIGAITFNQISSTGNLSLCILPSTQYVTNQQYDYHVYAPLTNTRVVDYSTAQNVTYSPTFFQPSIGDPLTFETAATYLVSQDITVEDTFTGVNELVNFSTETLNGNIFTTRSQHETFSGIYTAVTRQSLSSETLVSEVNPNAGIISCSYSEIDSDSTNTPFTVAVQREARVPPSTGDPVFTIAFDDSFVAMPRDFFFMESPSLLGNDNNSPLTQRSFIKQRNESFVDSEGASNVRFIYDIYKLVRQSPFTGLQSHLNLSLTGGDTDINPYSLSKTIKISPSVRTRHSGPYDRVNEFSISPSL